MIEGGAVGWSDPLVITGFGIFIVAAAVFLAIEARRDGPMLPLSFFGNRTFAATSLVGLLINVAFYGLIFDLSLYFQTIRGLTALTTGLAFVPMTGIVLGANLFAGRASSWLGVRPLMVLGQAILAGGCFLLVEIDADTPYRSLWWQMTMLGAGIGLTVPPMTSALLATVDRNQSGVASGVLNTTRQVGSVIGVALFGSLIANRNHFVTGMHRALYFSVVVSLIGAVAAFIAIRDDAAPEGDGENPAGTA
jgi:DHA2 family methylenomycin A resistance protein-like MFS transporter